MPDAARGFPVTLYAKYEDNVNTAVKGVAIAAERLRERSKFVAIQVTFRENRNELTLKVVYVSEDVVRSSQQQLDELRKGAKPSRNASDAKADRGALTVASATDYKVFI